MPLILVTLSLLRRADSGTEAVVVDPLLSTLVGAFFGIGEGDGASLSGWMGKSMSVCLSEEKHNHLGKDKPHL